MSQPQSYNWTVVAETTPPTLFMVRVVDARHLEVTFSEAVVTAEALNTANWLITGGAGLAVQSVAQVTSSVYTLTTAAQVPGTSYTLTASNIHDLNGNLI